MSPPFIFKIDEIRENPNVKPLATAQGHWIPSHYPGFNYRIGPEYGTEHGVSGTYYYCEGTRIRNIEQPTGPVPYVHYKTYSMFFSGGFGLWVMDGDGTAPRQGEVWHPLRFDPGVNYSSYLTIAGQQDTMAWHRTDQLWARMLLPSQYHGTITQDRRCGGLIGELPIFLALMAMSMEPAALQIWLLNMFINSAWQSHSLNPGRRHQRGVVVSVYLCPSSWQTGGTAQDMKNYENGGYGKYFN